MVSLTTILALCFTLFACFVFPIVLCIVFMRKTRPGILPLITGIVVFVLFVLVLESLMHYALLVKIPATRDLFAGNVWLYALYGSFAAGIFEECGRWLAFSVILKKKHEWKHGITYGIGHGGIEAVLLVAPSIISSLVFAVMINMGSFDAMIKSLPKTSSDALFQVKDSLISQAPWTFALSGVERICAISFQIALSVLVLYAVSKKKYIYILLAIVLHAAIDFPAVMYQKGLLTLWSVEVYCVVLAIPALIFIIKSRKLFPAPAPVPALASVPAAPGVATHDETLPQ